MPNPLSRGGNRSVHVNNVKQHPSKWALREPSKGKPLLRGREVRQLTNNNQLRRLIEKISDGCGSERCERVRVSSPDLTPRAAECDKDVSTFTSELVVYKTCGVARACIKIETSDDEKVEFDVSSPIVLLLMGISGLCNLSSERPGPLQLGVSGLDMVDFLD